MEDRQSTPNITLSRDPPYCRQLLCVVSLPYPTQESAEAPVTRVSTLMCLESGILYTENLKDGLVGVFVEIYVVTLHTFRGPVLRDLGLSDQGTEYSTHSSPI